MCETSSNSVKLPPPGVRTPEDPARGGVRCSWCPWCPREALGIFLLNFRESHTGVFGIHAFFGSTQSSVIAIAAATDRVSADADCDNGAGLHGTPRT